MERLTLAQAIRIGAAKRPQGFGSLFHDLLGDQRSCALGAAYEGRFNRTTWRKGENPQSILEHNYPELVTVRVACPVCSADGTLLASIVHLNDHHAYTREAIADWIENELTLTLTLPTPVRATEVTP